VAGAYGDGMNQALEFTFQQREKGVHQHANKT
jgi:hypothetical protein